MLEIRESRDRERGAFPSAQRAAREALDLTIKLHGDADWHTGDARRRLEDLDRLGRMKEGDRARLREADAQAAEVHRLWETGKSQEALPLARKVVATRRELLGEAHEMVANSLGRLAEYQEALGDIDGARAARQQVVDIRVRLLGKTRWEVTDARLALADCQRLATLTPGSRLELKSADQLFHEAGELRARGRFREAISPVQQSLAIRRRLLGEDHRLVADALNRLGLLYFSQLELDQADAPYQQAATIRKRVLGEDHPDYAESLNNLATIAMKRARPGQAEEMLKRAKEIMKTSFG